MLGIIEEGLTASEAVVEVCGYNIGMGSQDKITARTRNAPWCDDLDVWFQAIECQFESNLVVAFSGASVGHEATKR